ncbi:DUF3465 domain-containing protein [Komagataeibacter kakiaceti]|uniref:DUF3465 domain-containing protein n=1 Tax=Komagataeibacter kakiaceti TaxID=943261 RepID=UPI0005542BD0
MAKRRLWRYGVMALMAVLATQAAPPSAAQARSREHAWGETRHAQPDASPVPLQCDDRKFLADVEAAESTTGSHADRVEHVCGRVIAVSQARRTRSGWHGYFYVDTGGGISIRIVSDLDRMSAPAWPWVAKGDQADVLGRYYYDSPRSQGIDWTHHGTGRNWPVEGYVVINGNRYQ